MDASDSLAPLILLLVLCVWIAHLLILLVIPVFKSFFSVEILGIRIFLVQASEPRLRLGVPIGYGRRAVHIHISFLDGGGDITAFGPARLGLASTGLDWS
jgi:hypothetical protein